MNQGELRVREVVMGDVSARTLLKAWLWKGAGERKRG